MDGLVSGSSWPPFRLPLTLTSRSVVTSWRGMTTASANMSIKPEFAAMSGKRGDFDDMSG